MPLYRATAANARQLQGSNWAEPQALGAITPAPGYFTHLTAVLSLNPQSLTVATTVASDCNALSVGPIAISEGAAVTVADNATWSIH